ncbi:hypothetical protein BpHYR1_045291 [Brachionus plicatilis]|uniref:Uncharacterized protein n=1 Tax=Brachionus plicatilis TaxID=10195 RepID=A0A3M7SNA5_BRAPC|nr:hypothetical protein BpHYR1_045291 [Brachionus plicatilis]
MFHLEQKTNYLNIVRINMKEKLTLKLMTILKRSKTIFFNLNHDKKESYIDESKIEKKLNY